MSYSFVFDALVIAALVIALINVARSHLADLDADAIALVCIALLLRLIHI